MSKSMSNLDLAFLGKIKFRRQNRKPIHVKVYGIGYTFERPGCYCTECFKLFRREGDQFDPCHCENVPDKIIFNKYGGLFTNEKCNAGRMVVHQPSKLDIPVQSRSVAPIFYL